MMHYDLIVIGSGPAGEKGAAKAAYYGKKVAVVERASYLGGTGLNTGTIPSKTLRETALYFSGLKQRGLYGIDYSLKQGLTVSHLMHREAQVIETERCIVEENLRRHAIELIRGDAYFLDASTICLRETGERITADTFLLATGSTPYHPPGIPIDHQTIYDSDSILRMDSIPSSLLVLGAGVVGIEYASLFAALDVQVTVVDVRDAILPMLDNEIRDRLQRYLEELGVKFSLGKRYSSVSVSDGSVRVELEDGGLLRAEKALFAAGRRACTSGMGLEEVGVQISSRGEVQVNDRFETTVKGIYAAGDVIGRPGLASFAMEQARMAMIYALNLEYRESCSSVMPFAIYAIPELSMAGLTEEECKRQGIEYAVGRALYRNNPRGQIIGDETGMLKLVFRRSDRIVIGVHIIGELASELIHLGAEAISYQRPLDSFLSAVYNYPTLTDLYKYAAYDGLGVLERNS